MARLRGYEADRAAVEEGLQQVAEEKVRESVSVSGGVVVFSRLCVYGLPILGKKNTQPPPPPLTPPSFTTQTTPNQTHLAQRTEAAQAYVAKLEARVEGLQNELDLERLERRRLQVWFVCGGWMGGCFYSPDIVGTDSHSSPPPQPP